MGLTTMRRRLLGVCASVGALTALTLGLADVDASITEDDRRAIATLDLAAACGARSSFDDDVECVRLLQARLAAAAPDGRCVHRWGAVSHEPAAFLARGRGCCYDRSRLIEKALALHGFETRHVSLHELHLPAPFGYLQSVRSHAISEVRTRRGFMVVDSNRAWVALDARGFPLDSRALRDALRRDAPLAAPASGDYFGGNYSVFYGLYSRHGGFFPPFAPVPDVDLAQLHYHFE
jgi:hypothetical protein